MDDKTAEEIVQKNYELGRISRQEEIAERLRERAGKLFAVGRDVEAKIDRDTAKELGGEAVEMRQKYDNKYHKNKSE